MKLRPVIIGNTIYFPTWVDVALLGGALLGLMVWVVGKCLGG